MSHPTRKSGGRKIGFNEDKTGLETFSILHIPPIVSSILKNLEVRDLISISYVHPECAKQARQLLHGTFPFMDAIKKGYCRLRGYFFFLSFPEWEHLEHRQIPPWSYEMDYDVGLGHADLFLYTPQLGPDIANLKVFLEEPAPHLLKHLAALVPDIKWLYLCMDFGLKSIVHYTELKPGLFPCVLRLSIHSNGRLLYGERFDRLSNTEKMILKAADYQTTLRGSTKFLSLFPNLEEIYIRGEEIFPFIHAVEKRAEKRGSKPCPTLDICTELTDRQLRRVSFGSLPSSPGPLQQLRLLFVYEKGLGWESQIKHFETLTS